jgi:D-alanyl-D-alanine dipeptidase
MLHGGMTMIPNEWWHFNDGTAAEVRRRYTRLDVGLETVDAPAPAR